MWTKKTHDIVQSLKMQLSKGVLYLFGITSPEAPSIPRSPFLNGRIGMQDKSDNLALGVDRSVLLRERQPSRLGKKLGVFAEFCL